MGGTASQCLVGKDGYPPEWHTLKHEVRAAAGHRCVRCRHPYETGKHGKGEWTPCDAECRHDGPVRGWHIDDGHGIEAQWRILTVHHLDGDKTNLKWWNLAALCQRCHLQIQGRVKMERRWPHEHTDWFKPYVAGYYAHAFLKADLTRAEVENRLEELLALEDRQLPLQDSASAEATQ